MYSVYSILQPPDLLLTTSFQAKYSLLSVGFLPPAYLLDTSVQFSTLKLF